MKDHFHQIMSDVRYCNRESTPGREVVALILFNIFNLFNFSDADVYGIVDFSNPVT